MVLTSPLSRTRSRTRLGLLHLQLPPVIGPAGHILLWQLLSRHRWCTVLHALELRDSNASGTYFHSMLLTYEVAFDTYFDWVKGGKLPGLRGGLNSTGCSGGNKADGLDCFSSRLMWRKNGAGEGA